MFLGERRQLVEDLVLAGGTSRAGRRRWRRCCRCSARTSAGSCGRWTACRSRCACIDPPLHEFLPDLTELSVEVAVAEAKGEPVDQKRATCSTPSGGCTRATR